MCCLGKIAELIKYTVWKYYIFALQIDDMIDVIEGNRKFVKCLYVYNKIDQIGMEDVDEIARKWVFFLLFHSVYKNSKKTY